MNNGYTGVILRVDLKSVGPYPLIFAGAVFLSWPVSYSSTLSMRFLFFHITAMLCVGVTVSAVEHVDDSTANVLFEVHRGEHVCLIPAHEEFITGVDAEQRILYTSLPEGLVGLNAPAGE